MYFYLKEYFVVVVVVIVGDPVLRASMAVEELGGGQDSCPHDGPGRGHLLRSGEETEEEAPARLPGRQSQAPQLVGLSLLFLRNARTRQRRRYVNQPTNFTLLVSS